MCDAVMPPAAGLRLTTGKPVVERETAPAASLSATIRLSR